MKATSGFIIALLLLFSLAVSQAARPDLSIGFKAELKKRSAGKGGGNQNGSPGGAPVGPGSGFGIPDFGSGWANGIIGGGYGAGYSGLGGGIVGSAVTCMEKGPCYKKKLTCPAKCFSSNSKSGKNYGGGGGGGGCTMDCKKCIAFC